MFSIWVPFPDNLGFFFVMEISSTLYSVKKSLKLVTTRLSVYLRPRAVHLFLLRSNSKSSKYIEHDIYRGPWLVTLTGTRSNPKFWIAVSGHDAPIPRPCVVCHHFQKLSVDYVQFGAWFSSKKCLSRSAWWCQLDQGGMRFPIHSPSSCLSFFF